MVEDGWGQLRMVPHGDKEELQETNLDDFNGIILNSYNMS